MLENMGAGYRLKAPVREWKRIQRAADKGIAVRLGGIVLWRNDVNAGNRMARLRQTLGDITAPAASVKAGAGSV